MSQSYASIRKIGAQALRLLSLWARQNLQLLTSSKSGWRALVQVMLPLVHVVLKWPEDSGRPEILTIRRNFDKSCQYNRRYSTGVAPPIKAEQPDSSDHLRSTCTRGDITWTRALQPDLEEVSSWRFCRAQIVPVSRRTTYPPKIFDGCLIFWHAQKFS